MSRFLSLLPLIALACAPVDEVAWEGSPLPGGEATQHPAPSNDLGFSVSALIPGASVQLRVTGVAPGEMVFFVRGMAGRALEAGPCPAVLGGLCLDMPGPVVLLASTPANAQGVASLQATVPATLPLGREVVFQAVVPRGAASLATLPLRRFTVDAVASLDDLELGDVVVSELLRDPTQVADAAGEWFELHNASAITVDLQGLVVSDLDGDSFQLTTPFLIPPGGYGVIGAQANPQLNGGLWLDSIWSDTTLANGADELVLTAPWGELDRVVWTSAWPGGAGVATALSDDALDPALNDDPQRWCAATATYGLGDRGTPGGANPTCAPALPNDPPQADLDCPEFGEVGELLTLDASLSVDPDGALYDHTFDFGDGTTSSGLPNTAAHAYTTAGTYTPSVTITDDRGATDMATCSIEVYPPMEEVVIDAGVNFSSVSSRNFTINGVPPAITDTTLSYRFLAAVCSGAATTRMYFTVNGSSQQVATGSAFSSCSYSTITSVIDAGTINAARSATGTIAANVYASDSCAAGIGCSNANDPLINTVQLTMDIPSPNPILVCPAEVEVGDLDTLSGMASTAHWDDPVTYTFVSDVGGTISSGIQAAIGYQFDTAGTETITLTITDRLGLSASTSCQVLVVAP